MKVLIVDDEPGIREVSRRVLGAAGADVAVAASGAEAVSRLEQRWDLVVTDVAMPGGIDGLALLQRAREGGADVIMMTAYPDLGSTLAAIRRRAFDYLVKPFSIEELRTVFDRWLESRGETAAEPAAERALPDVEKARAQAAVALFCDLRGYSRYAASAGAEQAADALAELLPAAMEAVRACGGAVQQVMGDGFLALFGGGPGDAAPAAARAALAARAAAEEANRRRTREGRTALPMGFGFEAGPVVADALGGTGRSQLTFVGHAVNVAARLEKAAAAGTILVGPAAAIPLVGRFRLDPLPPLRVHGLDAPLPAFELVD